MCAPDEVGAWIRYLLAFEMCSFFQNAKQEQLKQEREKAHEEAAR